jgi:hypothetical protein
VKQKIVASRGFFPTCDIKNTEKPQPQPFCQTLYKMALASPNKSFYHSSHNHSCFSHSHISAKGALSLGLHFLKLGTEGLLIFTGYMLWGFFFTRREIIKEDRRRRKGLSSKAIVGRMPVNVLSGLISLSG